MTKLKTAPGIGLAIVFCFVGVLANWIAARNGLVSDLSPFWFETPTASAPVNPRPAEPGNICGMVVHANGEGIQNARVHLRGDLYGGIPFAYTDGNGEFTFRDVPAEGTYSLTVRANGLVFSRPRVTVDRLGCEGDIRFVADPSE